MNEETKTPIAPTATAPTVDIEKIIADLEGQGLKPEAILPALEQMLQEGKITEEDLARAKELLAEKEDKAQASDLFGVNIL